ncbi:piggyBac transposable element-derived protein 4-like [Vespula maculifrons]|uniref:PiggyBac transposable element-derived protein 4-like n=1 Tax=Vespula maculifrons TaxID=7453 RepID=A0ABD2ATC2_VESMC
MTLILPITTISVRMSVQICIGFQGDKGSYIPYYFGLWKISHQIIVTLIYYTPSQHFTIDEQQLLSTKCRCSFKVHIKSKPDKYELKIIIQHISVRATDYTVLSTKPISRTRKVDAKFAKKETVSISRKVKLRRMGNVFPHSSEGDKIQEILIANISANSVVVMNKAYHPLKLIQQSATKKDMIKLLLKNKVHMEKI